MLANMLLEMSLPVTAIGTHGAGEASLSGVAQHMFGECHGYGCPEGALVTLQGSGAPRAG